MPLPVAASKHPDTKGVGETPHLPLAHQSFDYQWCLGLTDEVLSPQVVSKEQKTFNSSHHLLPSTSRSISHNVHSQPYVSTTCCFLCPAMPFHILNACMYTLNSHTHRGVGTDWFKTVRIYTGACSYIPINTHAHNHISNHGCTFTVPHVYTEHTNTNTFICTTYVWCIWLR